MITRIQEDIVIATVFTLRHPLFLSLSFHLCLFRTYFCPSRLCAILPVIKVAVVVLLCCPLLPIYTVTIVCCLPPFSNWDVESAIPALTVKPRSRSRDTRQLCQEPSVCRLPNESSPSIIPIFCCCFFFQTTSFSQ